MKQIRLKQTASQRIYDDYMKRIRKTISTLPKHDREDILMEFNSHIFEGIQNNTAGSEVDGLLNILQKLGTPEEVLKPLVADKKLVQATRTFNPIHVFKALLLNISNGFSFVFFSLLYLSLISGVFLIIAKLFTPSTVGLFFDGKEFLAFGLIDSEAVKGAMVREVFGLWFIPVTLLSTLILYGILTLLLRIKRNIKMKSTVIITLTFILSIPAFAQSQNKDVLKALKGVETELQSFLDVWKCPGYAVAVVDQNGLVWSKGFGYKNVEKKEKVDANTLFAIGSCSKAFTTALIGQLENDGKLSLDDKPSDHIRDFKFYNKEMDDFVTIKDLMCHRTGMPRHDFSWYFFPSYSRDSLINRIQYQDPRAGVRETWMYNNFMFLLQGVIIEKITGKSWEENVEESLMKP